VYASRALAAGHARCFLGSAAAQPHQAAGEQVADLAEVGWEMVVDGVIVTLHSVTIRIVLPLGEC
jgi:hypothetical protein